jgi:alpha-tubulin suppressor-like RCC1 family protein
VAGYKGRELSVLLAALLLMALSAASAGAAMAPGKAFAWGYDEKGQLGNGAAGPNTNVPRAVSNLSGVKSVKAGCDHALALKENGSVWAWGDSQYGQLGNGNTGIDSDVPVVVQDLLDVKNIDGGYEFTLAVTR